MNQLATSGSRCKTACDANTSGSPIGGAAVCEDVPECQFNHVMWWTTKRFVDGTGPADGNLFSTQSSGILNYSSFIQ
jgi:hypothetical protein